MRGSILKFPKLVRDTILDRITKDGQIPRFRILKKDEMSGYAAAKICEEAAELAYARAKKDRAGMESEAADVLEALDAFLKSEGISWLTVRKRQREKARTHGRFKKRILLLKIDTKPKAH